MSIDNERVTAAVLATGAGPLALEEGSNLVDAWVKEGICTDKRIIAVECGFVCWLEEKTAIIGVQDLITDEDGTVGNEWKSTRGPGKYWDEEKWWKELTDGSQIAIYALAMRDGEYYPKGEKIGITLSVADPRIRVRAATKTAVPMFWPTKGEGIVTFTPEQLENTRRALIAKAAAIRAMRKESAPWQLPGLWCENKYRKLCQYYDQCLNREIPVGYGVFDPSDPAFELALPRIGDKLHDPEVVVLGASMYASASECAEKYRRLTLGGDKEQSMALETGTVLHAGVAEFYRQLREQQQS